MFGDGGTSYCISWTGSSPNIFQEHKAPLFSDLVVVVEEVVVVVAVVVTTKITAIGNH